MNTKNLIPNSQRSPSELREQTRKGGIASGKARRAKKSRREWAAIIGALPIDVVDPHGKTLEGSDLDAALVMAQYRKAVKGDSKAAKLILDLQGDLVQKIEHSGDVRGILVHSEDEKVSIESLKDLGV